LLLQKLGYLEVGPIPPLPDHLPSPLDEEPLGVGFFRARVADDRLENLTLPRTLFGRSEVVSVSFRNTDLSESNLCWNDFTDVDFSDASLQRSDIRASVFVGVTFSRANLEGADLRRSTFEDCDFAGARLTGAVVATEQQAALRLSAEQANQVVWMSDSGPEPHGG
jgi:uncharacterized protein YjbI with pentapeptide repeats